MCKGDSSDVLEQAVLLWGLWTHLSRLLMKNANARGTAGCLMHHLQRLIPAEKLQNFDKYLVFTSNLRVQTHLPPYL